MWEVDGGCQAKADNTLLPLAIFLSKIIGVVFQFGFKHLNTFFIVFCVDKRETDKRWSVGMPPEMMHLMMFCIKLNIKMLIYTF